MTCKGVLAFFSNVLYLYINKPYREHKMKNILQENMRRFGTKNLTEQAPPIFDVFHMEDGKRTDVKVGTYHDGKGFIPNDQGKKLGLQPDPTKIPDDTVMAKDDMMEAITVSGVKMAAANPGGGGPLKTIYNNILSKYSITAKTILYKGPIGISYIYSKDGEYYMTDNTGKKFNLPEDKLKFIAAEIKRRKKVIKITTTSWGVSVDITFTRKS